MDYLKVRNWEKFQHYADRSPPWIKLYNELLTNYEFSCLQDASKAHLVGIWLLASQLDNKIPNDSKWVAKRINATHKVDLNVLINSGFLESDSELLADRKQSACLETETETETDKSRGTRIPKDFELTDDRRVYAEKENLDAERTFLNFVDYWINQPGAKARKLDWGRTWQTWCRSSFNSGASRSSGLGGRRKTRFEENMEALDGD